MKKYAIHPGYVTSSDGAVSYVEPNNLVMLYGVDPKDCVLWDDHNPYSFFGRIHGDYIHLFPRSDGKYEKCP